MYFADAGQHLEPRLLVDHSATHCKSRVTYKGALQGQDAHTVWVGDVLIRAAAEQTDTYELNRNLVLTDGARADSVPNLEIETGEIVGAGHASATGRFDDEQLFYLQARGIREDEARRLVVRGFFADVIGRIGIPERPGAADGQGRGGARRRCRHRRRVTSASAERRDPNWVRVCGVSEVTRGPAQGGRGRRHPGGRRASTTAQFYAIHDVCSHANVALSEGEVVDCEIECWLHGSMFDLETGKPSSLPATEPVPVYPVKIEGDDLYVAVKEA